MEQWPTPVAPQGGHLAALLLGAVLALAVIAAVLLALPAGRLLAGPPEVRDAPPVAPLERSSSASRALPPTPSEGPTFLP